MRTHLKDGYVEQYAALARIVDNSLIIRDHRVFMIPSGETEPLPWDAILFICLHFTLFSMERLDDLAQLLEKPDPSGPEVCPLGTGLMRYLCCRAEFRVYFRSFGSRGTAVFVTRWKDLGSNSPTLDEKWWDHVLTRRWWDQVQFNRGSICTSFENEDYRSYDFDEFLVPGDWKRSFKGSPHPRPKLDSQLIRSCPNAILTPELHGSLPPISAKPQVHTFSLSQNDSVLALKL